MVPKNQPASEEKEKHPRAEVGTYFSCTSSASSALCYCFLLWLLYLPLRGPELLCGGVGHKDGDALRLGIELGEALYNEHSILVFDCLGDLAPLFVGNVDSIGCR